MDVVVGLDGDDNNLKDEVNSVKNHIFGIKRKFYFYKGSKKVAIFGDYDIVMGINKLLKELGIEVDRKEILYKTTCEDKSVIVSSKELDRMKYLIL